ncbi:MAG: lactate racemase domain-containing protein [Candidatus Thorarchaeota archaeon]|jgi:nickel-dependent lactate racemase
MKVASVSAGNFKWWVDNTSSRFERMRVDLPFGEGFLPLELDASAEYIAPPILDAHPNTSAELLRVIENPIDSPPLSKLVSDAKSVAIVVNKTEHTGLIRNLLHFLLTSVETFSLNKDDITIFYQIENEDMTTSSDVEMMLGFSESHDYSLVIHNPASSKLKHVGETPSHSTPVSVNERFLSADLKIGLGGIRPDVFAGATGGRMSVLPHVSGNKTIRMNTKLRVTHDIGPFLMSTHSCIDMIEASELSGLDFIVNFVSDWHGNVAHIFAGNSSSAWESGVKSAEFLARSDFGHKADIAIVSAGGSHSDSTLYDAIDCVFAAAEVTENGGAIVLVAECTNGFGPKGFLRGVTDYTATRQVSIADVTGFEIGFEKAHYLRTILDTRRLVICSQLRRSLVEERFRSSAVRDTQEGIEVAKSFLASSNKIAVLPDGIRTVPHFRIS